MEFSISIPTASTYKLRVFAGRCLATVWGLFAEKNWGEAKRCGREFADFLLLLDEGLGWEPECSEPTSLTVSADVLGRALEHSNWLRRWRMAS